MDLTFDRGDPDRPRGHAVVYYRDRDNPETVAATYIIILPVSVDFSKYVPPFLAGQVPNLGDGALTAFAFPPSPEAVESHEAIIALVERRDDDLIFAGSHQLTDVMGMMTSVSEIVEEYAARYDALSPAEADLPLLDEGTGMDGGETAAGDVDDVVYGMMSEADQLGELTRLVGRLRFATEGGDGATAEDASARVRALGRHMPPNRNIGRLLDAAMSPSDSGARMAQLYLERAYCLLREDYLRVKSLDEEIAAAEDAFG